LLTILICALTPSPGRSEHETYYRYIVLGYLEDAPGKPRPGVTVELTREKTGFSYAGTTDASGLYVLVARLGDESVGERLKLRAGADSVTITARFDPADHLRERGTRVDFVGGRPVERPAAFASTLRRFLEN
jgi:hypothetical protein